MTDDRIRAQMIFYAQYLARKKVGPAVHRMGQDVRDHLIGMAPKVVQFLKEGQREKAMRWLGFVQGVLWSHEVFTLDQLKDHSRPDFDPPKLEDYD